MLRHVSTLLFLCASLPVTSQARPLADEAGWSATLSLNLGYVESQSQFSTDDDNALTDDLHNSGQSINQALAYPLLRIDYTTRDLKNQFFLGNSRDNLGRGQFQYELGYTRQLSERSSLTAAYFPQLPFMNETWSDPYLIGEARQETDENYQGLRIEYKAIADSPFTLKYAYAQRSIDDERSGETLFSPGSKELELLRREADLHRISAEMFLPLSKQWFFFPALVYTTALADGDANDFEDYTLRLGAMYRQQQHMLNLNVEWGTAEYGAENPVFNRTQKDTTTSLFALYVYQQPFGWENALVNVIAGYSNSDSNIEFFDSQALFSSVGIGYKF